MTRKPAQLTDEGTSLATTLLQRLLRRPELGAVAGAVFVLLLFVLVADPAMFSARGIVNWLQVSAQLGVIAVGACLLMIAGEFDLSVGSMIAFSGMTIGILIKFMGLSPWLAVLAGFALALAIGWLVGLLVVRTALPSFIVSLAFLFILRGATIVFARLVNQSTLLGGLGDAKAHDALAWLFGGEVGHGVFVRLADWNLIATLPNGSPAVSGLPIIVIWCLALGGGAAFVLSSTRFGNWIFSTGGDRKAAMSVGVPVNRVRVLLFVFSAFCATVYGASQLFEFGSADAARGLMKEFEAIIAAVIGGALLTGGYGSITGALVGALIFGVVSQGFYYTGIDGDWFRIFLGCVLLAAVIFNTQVRKRVTGGL